MKIFNNNSIYQLLLFLLLTKKENRKAYIIGNSFPKQIAQRLDAPVINIGNDNFEIKKSRKILFLFNYINILIKLRLTFKKKLKKEIKGCEIYGASTLAVLLAKNNNDIYLLEDGTGNYRNKIKFNYKQKIQNILNFIFLKSTDIFQIEASPYITKLFLTGLGETPDFIKAKIIKIDLLELWQNKTKIEKNEILNIYGLDKNILSCFSNRKTILFTQPLSEDNFVPSEEEKIKIYKKSLNGIDYSNVIIKRHPREKTNYKPYFKGVEQIEGVFPFQLLMLMGFKFETAITLFSTTVLSLNKNIKIIWFGTTLSSILKEKLGDLPIEKYINNEK